MTSQRQQEEDEMNKAMAAALRQAALLPDLTAASEGCDCTHCIQAKHAEQVNHETTVTKNNYYHFQNSS